MPHEPTNAGLPAARRFRRTRAAHRDELAQDYAEAIAGLSANGGRARVKDLSTTMGVSHVTVSRALSRMRSRGLVDAPPRGVIALTPAGRRLAQQATRRHETVLSFLLWLGVPRAQAELDAEGIEHHVSAITIAAMRRAMARPAKG